MFTDGAMQTLRVKGGRLAVGEARGGRQVITGSKWGLSRKAQKDSHGDHADLEPRDGFPEAGGRHGVAEIGPTRRIWGS
jgi:hypothetical protein